MAQNVLDGGRSVLVALTPGERGHPRMSVDDYRLQKIAEAEQFGTAIGAEVIVFEDQSDGFLTCTDEVAGRLAEHIRRFRPDWLFAHWHRSIHTDHEQAALIAERARFLAALPGWREEDARHAVARLLHTENWEDAAGFEATDVMEISAKARRIWLNAIGQQAFARGETYGFRYIDYYDAQLTMRGALARVPYAVGFSAGRQPRTQELA